MKSAKHSSTYNRQQSMQVTRLEIVNNFSGNLSEDNLFNLLITFVIYRPDIGYVQNMGYLAATLLAICPS